MWGAVGGGARSRGGLTNERPGTDHVILGSMRGLTKNAFEGNIHTDTRTDIATTRKNQP